MVVVSELQAPMVTNVSSVSNGDASGQGNEIGKSGTRYSNTSVNMYLVCTEKR